MSSDLIRLSDLMKFPIRIDHYDKVNGNEHFVLGIESVLEYAENLPRVEAEPVVHAHWVRLTPEFRPFLTPDYTHSCSNCGKHGYKHYKRCYDCGAVMDEKMPPEPTPLIRLDLGGRINKRLKQMGVTTVEQLEAMDKHTLHNIPGLGRRSIETIESELRIWKELKEKKDELLER